MDYPILAPKPKSHQRHGLPPYIFLPSVVSVFRLGRTSHLRLDPGTITVPQLKNFIPEDAPMITVRRLALATLILSMAAASLAQQVSKHVLSADEVKKAVPAEYFFRGQKAPVQLRNAVGFQLADGKMMLAALVDASGYSTAIQQKYQGLLITEVKLDIGGSTLNPGQYGFGFTSDGKFVVMDVGNNDVLSEASQTESSLQHAVPLKLAEDGAGYKLYAGKKWVVLKSE